MIRQFGASLIYINIMFVVFFLFKYQKQENVRIWIVNL